MIYVMSNELYKKFFPKVSKESIVCFVKRGLESNCQDLELRVVASYISPQLFKYRVGLKHKSVHVRNNYLFMSPVLAKQRREFQTVLNSCADFSLGQMLKTFWTDVVPSCVHVDDNSYYRYVGAFRLVKK